MGFSRRRFTKTLAALGLIVPQLAQARYQEDPQRDSDDGEAHHHQHDGPFQHGVASGDPLSDRVILWTRITTEEKEFTHRSIPVKWQIARDPEFEQVVSYGKANASAEHDFTVKIDAAGLDAATTYYYRFSALGHTSTIGRTKTLPTEHIDRLRVAMTSCSNYPYGYFNVYGMIAERDDLDVVLHLGDYIYEYANGTYGDGTAINRIPSPDKEIITLDDYRQRYAQYRRDADLQQAHRQHAFITVWDDHEAANNAWANGAQNHNPELGEGDWGARKAAAIKAYYEWIPIRMTDPSDPARCYRQFQFGNLMDLVMLDTRLYARDQQVSDARQLAAIDNPQRHLLGEKQMQWFLDNLSSSYYRGTRWRMVGQQVMFGQLQLGGNILNVDQWDGYRAARSRVLDHLAEHGIDNTVILTGDIHSSWAMDICPDPYNPALYSADSGEGSMAVEFVTPGVTSPGILDPVEAVRTAALLQSANPHMKFVELLHRGYVLLDIDHQRTQAEWYHAESILEANNRKQSLAAMMQTRSGSNHLIAATTVSQPRSNLPPRAPDDDEVTKHRHWRDA